MHKMFVCFVFAITTFVLVNTSWYCDGLFPSKEQKCSLKQETHELDGCPYHDLCSKRHLFLQLQLENLNHLDLKSI